MEKIRLLGLIVLVSMTAVVQAQPQDEAKAHFKRGTDLYDENNFRGALVEFQKAYEVQPSYKILFNIGQVEMELQDYAGAVKAYSRYLREGGPDVPQPRVAQVQAEIDRLKGRIGHITITTAAGAEVLIDEVSAGYAPLPEPATVNAGRHTVTVHVSGRDPVSRAVDVAGLEQVTVVLANDVPVTTVPGKTDEPSKPRGKTPMIAAWAVTGALAVTAGIFLFTASSDANDLATLRNTYPVTKAQLDSQASKTSTAAAIADGFTAGAVIAAGIAVYLTLTQPPSPRADKAVRLQITPNGAYVRGHF